MACTLASLVTLVSEWKDLPETVQRAFVAMAPRAMDGDVEGMQRSPARLASLSLVLDRWHGMAGQAGDAALKQDITELQAFVADVQASGPVRSTRTAPRAKDVLGELPDDEPPAPALSTY